MTSEYAYMMWSASFDTAGEALTQVAAEAPSTWVLTVRSDGDVVAAGIGYESQITLVAFTSAGAVDPTFGMDGIVVGQKVGYGTSGCVIDGEIIMAGYAMTFDSFILERLIIAPGTTVRLYVEQDADYNVTSITDGTIGDSTLGEVLERYEYDPDGNVTVLNPDGTMRSDGTIASSLYGWVYTFQGGRG